MLRYSESGGQYKTMSIAIEKEFRVLVTQTSVTEPNGQQGRWRATALAFPGIAEEGASREQVIRQIQARIVEILRHSEIVTLTVPAFPLTKEDEELLARGWDDHGLFKNDPEALKLFDEIEEERDRHLVGDA
jgi:hypothetical protein